ncbi:MAG: MATE family efflux transporter [Candidatus Neomarinimicrobiota bacterium]
MSASDSQNQSQLTRFLSDPHRALWRLSLPILGGMTIHTLYSVVDMMFVGWVGADAVAAMAYNMPLVFFSIGITIGITSGVTAVVAQAIGAGEKSRANNTAEHALVLGLVLGLALAAAGLIFGRELLAVLGADGDLNQLAWSYFQVTCYGLVFMVLSSNFRAILTGEGDTMRPMKILGAGMVLNIILDPIFIFTLEMGVRGAAVATMVSQIIAFLAFIYLVFIRRSTYLHFRLRHFAYSWSILGAILRIGVPASLAFVIMSTGGGVFNKILTSYSHDAVAAYQMSNRLEMLFFMPMIAIATGCVTLVGMFFGAGELDKLRDIVRYTMSRTVLLGLVSMVVMFTFAPQLLSIFRPNPEILEYGVSFLRVVAFAYPLIPLGMISGRVLQGLGQGLPMLIFTFLRVLAVSAPLALVFTYVLDKPVVWVWYAMLISVVVAASVAITWLAMILHRLEQLPRPGKAPPEKEIPSPVLAG